MNRGEMFEYCTPVAPSPRERGAFQDAVRLARELGVAFQPGQVEAYWWRREAHEPWGFTEFTTPVCVWLPVGGDAEQIVRTAGHELLHAREFLDGRDMLDPRGANGEEPESEVRAKAFAERVLARWLAQRRPRPTIPQPGSTAPANERITHMHTMSSPFELASLPALVTRAVAHTDLAKLDRRRRIAASRRVFRPHDVLSDSGLVKLTATAALMDEFLADADLEAAEAKILLDCKNRCAARLESAD